jgi:hypothetical protein
VRTKVTVSLLVVGLLLLPILGGAAVYYDWWGTVTRSFGPGDGRIIVSSPSVYTRQRLVNDRLTQNAWLQAQLDVTKGVLSTFHAIDAIRHDHDQRVLDINAAVSSKTGKDGRAETKKEATPEAKDVPLGDGQSSVKPDPEAVPSADSYQVEPTTADLFQAMNTYREEVRSEMMQTQLDDRHDILGNTIYRLATDVTVLAGQKADNLALVSVVLHYDPSENPSQYGADYTVVYNDWLRYVQRIVNDSVDGLAKSLTAHTLESRVRVTLPYFLAGALCKSIEAANGSDSQIGEPCNVWRPERTPSLDLTWHILDSYVSQYLEYRAGIVRARFERDLLAAATAKGWKPQGFPYAFDFASRDCDTQQGRITTTFVQENGGQNVEVRCPLFTLPDEGLIAGLTLYDYLVTHPFALVDQVRDPQTSNPKAIARKLLTDSLASNCSGAPQAACITPDLTPAQFSCAAAEYIAWSLDALGNPRALPTERIGYFLGLRPVGRQFQNCALMVTALTSLDGKKHDSGDHDPDDPVAHLSSSLDASNEVYAYSVTPKNLSERVSTTTDIRDAVQLLLSAKAGMGVGDATSMSNLIRKRAENIQAIQRHAVVVGFGHSRGKGSSKPPYETSFGWALGPHLGANGAQAQVDEQYGLAALISVPSWWRSVKLEIQTCWINRKDLQPSLDKPEDVCIGSTVQKHIDIVRLPGVASDISRKLGFDIIQEPHLNPVQERQILQVGYPGDVLLAGGRLWRSTEVTLGSQRADRINVLPDMEGIVAHFDCVRPQFAWGKRFEEPFPVPVTVWTSEGKAEITDNNENAVRVDVPEGFWTAAANRDPCSSKSGAQPSAAAQASQSTESGIPRVPARPLPGQAAPQPIAASPGPEAKAGSKQAEGPLPAR